MAYKALYRTYRPNSFDEVYGQKHIVQTLKHAVEQNNMLIYFVAHVVLVKLLLQKYLPRQ